MPKSTTRAARSPRRPGTQQLVVEDRVLFAADTLADADRRAVERAVGSLQGFRELTYQPRGVGATGKLRVARVSPSVRLMYQETPTRVTVLDLVNEGTFEALGVATYPVRRPAAARPGKRSTPRETV